jgi:hypothetical protein
MLLTIVLNSSIVMFASDEFCCMYIFDGVWRCFMFNAETLNVMQIANMLNHQAMCHSTSLMFEGISKGHWVVHVGSPLL